MTVIPTFSEQCTNLKQPYCFIKVRRSVKNVVKLKETQLFYLVIKLPKPVAVLKKVFRKGKAKRGIGITFFRSDNYTDVIENFQ